MTLSDTEVGFDVGLVTLSMSDPDPASRLDAQLRPSRRILRPGPVPGYNRNRYLKRKKKQSISEAVLFFLLIVNSFGKLQGERVGGEVRQVRENTTRQGADAVKNRSACARPYRSSSQGRTAMIANIHGCGRGSAPLTAALRGLLLHPARIEVWGG